MTWRRRIATDIGMLFERGLLWLAQNSVRFGEYAAAILRARQNRRAAAAAHQFVQEQ